MIVDDNSDVTLSGGDDVAYIQGNNDTVRGGFGGDRLATSLSNDLTRAMATTLWGGEGNDTLHAAMTQEVDGYEYGLTVNMDGGEGEDEIGIYAASASTTPQSLTADGGAGADTITIESRFFPEDLDAASFYHTVTVDVDGGDGSDLINVFVRLPGIDDSRTTIDAGEGNDVVNVTGGAVNVILGGSGNDTITAEAGVWQDWGSEGTNEIDGGEGNDVIQLRATGWDGKNIGHGGDGHDEMTLFANGPYVSNVAHGDAGDDMIDLRATSNGAYESYDGASGSNEGHGGDGHDVISAAIDLTSIIYPEDPPALPENGINLLYGDAGNDRLTARISVDDASDGDFHSELFGGAGNDRLKVSGGTDNELWGNVGDDTLLGSTGDDLLIGGQGNDYLRGYAGDDTFEFQSARNGERDRIDGFTIGDDTIDISQIDANVFRSGNQAFTFGEQEGTGRLWIEDYGTRSIVHADTGRAVFDLVLLDGGVTASDYGASDFLL